MGIVGDARLHDDDGEGAGVLPPGNGGGGDGGAAPAVAGDDKGVAAACSDSSGKLLTVGDLHGKHVLLSGLLVHAVPLLLPDMSLLHHAPVLLDGVLLEGE